MRRLVRLAVALVAAALAALGAWQFVRLVGLGRPAYRAGLRVRPLSGPELRWARDLERAELARAWGSELTYPLA